MTSLLPDTLLDSHGNSVATSTLQGKVLGLYFSAHWCGPCRAFTPQLSTWLAHFKASSPHASQLEIVFVSSDRDEASFKEYHATMGFHAVPYANRDAKAQLSSQFGVRGIPTLIFVDAEGHTLTKNGREIVTSDPKGAGFPWAPKSLTELIGTSFVNNHGQAVGADAIKDKYLGIYFSAHWCPPCRGFTPELVKTYNKLKAAGKPFEIIFASSDSTEAQFKEYFETMPWLALPFGDKRKEELSRHFEVDGIPTLVLLTPELKVITSEGRGAVSSDPEGNDFPWLPKPLNALTEGTVGTLNSMASLVVVTEGTPESIEAAKAALQDVAEAEFAKEPKKLAVLYADPEEEVLESVRSFARLDENINVFILDIPRQVKFVGKDVAINASAISAFVSAFHAGSLPSSALR